MTQSLGYAGTTTLPLIPIERRKHVRVGMAIPAQVVFGEASHSCTLVDASPGGGKIRIEDDARLPDHFTLLFTTTGTVRRVCNVVWRRDSYIGVAFAGRFDHIV